MIFVILFAGQHHAYCHLHESSHDGGSINDANSGSINMTTFLSHHGNNGVYGQLSGLTNGSSNTLSYHPYNNYNDNPSDLSHTEDSSARLLTGVNGTRVILVCNPSTPSSLGNASLTGNTATVIPSSNMSSSSYNHPCLAVYGVIGGNNGTSTENCHQQIMSRPSFFGT